MEILKARRVGRNTETAEQIEKRTQRAFDEMKYQNQYEHIVVNDDLETAIQEVIAIIEK